jgi:hypothetical protein
MPCARCSRLTDAIASPVDRKAAASCAQAACNTCGRLVSGYFHGSQGPSFSTFRADRHLVQCRAHCVRSYCPSGRPLRQPIECRRRGFQVIGAGIAIRRPRGRTAGVVDAEAGRAVDRARVVAIGGKQHELDVADCLGAPDAGQRAAIRRCRGRTAGVLLAPAGDAIRASRPSSPPRLAEHGAVAARDLFHGAGRRRRHARVMLK